MDTATVTYCRARAALVNLGIPEDDVIFRPLLDTELYMKNTNKPAEFTEGKTLGFGMQDGVVSHHHARTWHGLLKVSKIMVITICC